jgi:hypothetical protein
MVLYARAQSIIYAKVVLGHFGSAWGIVHRTSTKHYKEIEVNCALAVRRRKKGGSCCKKKMALVGLRDCPARAPF